MKPFYGTILMVTALCCQALGQVQKPSVDCPTHEEHQKQHSDEKQHVDEMNHRGKQGMGFDQASTTHHFRILAGGGAIEVEANSADDSVSRDQIRTHLKRITIMFSEGDFAIPMFVHDQLPPGAQTMKQLKKAIKYNFEETGSGGRVRITTRNDEALRAIHAFLRFQIGEHHTSDKP
jgi:hypothetical protein